MIYQFFLWWTPSHSVRLYVHVWILNWDSNDTSVAIKMIFILLLNLLFVSSLNSHWAENETSTGWCLMINFQQTRMAFIPISRVPDPQPPQLAAWVPHPPRPRGKGGMSRCQPPLPGPPQCECGHDWSINLRIFSQNDSTIFTPAHRWVYKMQDASAKYPRLGLLEGHQHFPGNFQSCLEIKTGDKVIGDGRHCMMLAFPPSLESGKRKYTQGEIRSMIKGEGF